MPNCCSDCCLFDQVVDCWFALLYLLPVYVVNYWILLLVGSSVVVVAAAVGTSNSLVPESLKSSCSFASGLCIQKSGVCLEVWVRLDHRRYRRYWSLSVVLLSCHLHQTGRSTHIYCATVIWIKRLALDWLSNDISR